jgi:hypothetical protein
MVMSGRKRVISSVMAAAFIAIIVFANAAMKTQDVYTDSFCLIEDGHQTCGFHKLSLCLQSMGGMDSDCVREIKGADREPRKQP